MSCTSFTDDFSGTSLNTAKWTFSSSSSNGSNGIANGKIKLFLPLGTKGEWAAINSKNKVNGNFTAELVLKSMSTTNNKNTGVLALFFQTSTEKSLKFYRQADKTALIMGVNNGTASSDWNFQEKDIGLTNSTPVKIKLERVGSTVKMFYDLLDGKGYQLARQFNNFYTGEGWITVGIESTEPDFPQTSGTFDDFKLTCAVSTPTPTPTPPSCTSQGGFCDSKAGVCGDGAYLFVPNSDCAVTENCCVPITPTPTGTVTLSLKLKFQGINKLPATGENSMTVKVKVQKNGEATSIDGTGTFVADAAGIWSGTVGVNIPTISGKYKIMVKGPQHIQKKICDSTPTETTGAGLYRCSSGNVTLVAGDNNLDFSGILLLAGDLDQNGIVDSVDFGLVKNNLGKTDTETLAKADINRDGKVDTQDFSLIIAALGIRTDEL